MKFWEARKEDVHELSFLALYPEEWKDGCTISKQAAVNNNYFALNKSPNPWEM